MKRSQELRAGSANGAVTAKGDKSAAWIEILTHAIHKHFLVILISCYVLAAYLPGFGLWIRDIQFGRMQMLDGSSIKITLSSLLLSFLLFNAGLGIQTQELLGLLKKPSILAAGFLVNLILPIAIVFLLSSLLGLWHSSDELQNLLVGIALIAAMPIAGSSTAWSQNANGNVSLSLGLVFLSTVLSPLTTPAVLHVFGSITRGDYSADLHEIAQQGTNAFMCATVVLPSLCGIAANRLLGERKASHLKPALKLLNFSVLLILNYSNAALSLPAIVKNPDWDFLGFVYITTIGLCVLAFAVGWILAQAFRTAKPETASLMFGLGMNNNGTGLVLASITLADHPAVMLPMIFYTLAQQVVAAIVDRMAFKNEAQ